jgi:hypothetical protein
MDEAAVASYILETFVDVTSTEALGYRFFFYGADRMLPFATMIGADQPHDRYSDLDRPGVFRLNIGVSRETFQSLFGTAKPDVSAYDHTALDTIMPHPEYAAQNWVCVLSAGQATFEKVRGLLAEAHGLAVRREARRGKKE